MILNQYLAITLELMNLFVGELSARDLQKWLFKTHQDFRRLHLELPVETQK